MTCALQARFKLNKDPTSAIRKYNLSSLLQKIICVRNNMCPNKYPTYAVPNVTCGHLEKYNLSEKEIQFNTGSKENYCNEIRRRKAT